MALDRKGPGLLLRDIAGGKDAQIAAIGRVAAALNADVLILTAFDYDRGGVALDAFAAALAQAGAAYPHRFALAPNSGVPTRLDLDGDGLRGGPRDAQGYGLFPGNAGMAILSRLPVDRAGARDLSRLLWRDLPDGIPPPLAQDAGVQRLSTTGHWIVPLLLPDGRSLRLLTWYATPPVFDGEEDRNGRRNHDEAALWLRLLEGQLPVPPPAPPFVIAGDANLDPEDGEGRPEALRALLAHPGLQNPAPRGTHRRVEPGTSGDPALDTALYDEIGGLRVDYILPSADLTVAAAGVLWPPEGDPLAADLAAASRHRPVWVDLVLP
ncbi:MAG: endonuclease/exonuclease/phosphatase family protein [Paracoccaceae bacterium]